MNWQQHIERNPRVMQGKPVDKGTRITMQLILEMLAKGSDVADILKSCPHLKRARVRAADLAAASGI